MLPHALSSNICSLVEGEDRLTQTVVLELDAKGKVRKAEFHDGVIRSAARHHLPAGPGHRGRRRRAARAASPRSSPSFERMDELAKLMRKRRYERGSLDFDLPEPKLVLDASGEITGHRGHRAPGQHAGDRGVHAGRQRGGGGEAVQRRHPRALPRPRDPRPRARGGVRRAGGVVRLPGARQPRGHPARGLPARPPPDRGQARGEAHLLPAPADHEAGALPRGEPRPLRPGHRDVRALHEPHPALSRPRRPPRPARAAPGRATDGAHPRGPAGDGPAPLGDGAPRGRGRARADRVEEGPLHGGQAGRGLHAATSPASRPSASSSSWRRSTCRASSTSRR